MNSRSIFRTLLLLSLALATQVRAENAVLFSDATGDAGGTVTVDVIIENDLAIGGAAIPFRWSSPDLSLESVQFVRDRFNGDIAVLGSSSAAPQTGAILIRSNYPNPGWIDRGSGLVAQLRYRVAVGAASQWVSLDSILEIDGGVKTTVTQFSDVSGLRVIYPVVYGGRITIGDPHGQTNLSTVPDRLEFRALINGPSPPSQSVSIRALDGPPVSWRASATSTWLRVSPVAGRAPGELQMSVDQTGLTLGDYSDTVAISSPEAINSPLRIPVALSVDTAVLRSFTLSQNRPNPFSTYHDATTSMAYTLAMSDHVDITLYDVLGRPVRHLVERQVDAGEHIVTWDGRNDHGQKVASGHYFCRMKTSVGTATRQMVVIK